MKHYFALENKLEEKDAAVSFPNKYAFWICYFDEQLKERIWLDHRLVPAAMIKAEKHFKEYAMIITITFHTSTYKFLMDIFDYKTMYADRNQY